jgi:hypothetical protein
MSVKWMAHVWANGPRNGIQRAILVALADHASDDGHAFPSVPHLVEKTQFSTSTVKRTLDALEADGWFASKPGVGRSKKTIYQLNWKPVPAKRVQPEPLLADQKGSTQDAKRVQPEQEKGSHRLSPLIKFLTVNESSGNVKALTKTLSGDKGEKGEHNPPVSAAPPSPNPNPEARTLIDLIVCASPWAVLRSMRVADVLPEHRIPVIEAYKHEARASGISSMQALDGLLRVVEGQISSLPRDELRFLGDIKTYFGKRNYRIGTQELTGGGANGKFKGKGRAIEDTLREFFGSGGDSESVRFDGIEAGSRSRPDDPKTLHGRLM